MPRLAEVGSRIRRTIFSPYIVGKVLTRKSIDRLFESTKRMRQSCGTRFSAILRREITLMREAIFSLMTRGGEAASRKMPSVRKRTR